MMLSARNSILSELFTNIPKGALVSFKKLFNAVSIPFLNLWPSLISIGITPKGASIIRSISDLSLVL